MKNGALTPIDSGFDINHPAYAADARRTTPSTEKINLRVITPDARLVRPAPFSLPTKLQAVSVVPRATLSGVPLPSCAELKTTAEVTMTTADTVASALKKPASVTQPDVDALVIGDTVVSKSGTTREIIGTNRDTFIFHTTIKITGEALTYFVTKDAGEAIDFSQMNIGDRVYNGGTEYTIKSILKTSEGVVNTVNLSRFDTIEDYRAQGFDHIDHIIKKS